MFIKETGPTYNKNNPNSVAFHRFKSDSPRHFLKNSCIM